MKLTDPRVCYKGPQSARRMSVQSVSLILLFANCSLTDEDLVNTGVSIECSFIQAISRQIIKALSISSRHNHSILRNCGQLLSKKAWSIFREVRHLRKEEF